MFSVSCNELILYSALVSPLRYYVMRNHVVEKVLKLIRRKEKYLVVAAVRFLRTCVSLKVGFVGVNLA